MKQFTDRALRIVTAVAPYDGHDASVLALNRALLASGKPVEVIYLGFNMSTRQIVDAAVQEGADAVAVSSYNGGHLLFYPQLVKSLQGGGATHVLVFGGGGGTILPEDARAIELAGVEKIYGPGRPLTEIARDLVARILKKRKIGPSSFDPEVLRLVRNGEQSSVSALLDAVAYSESPKESIETFFAGEKQTGCRTVIVTGDGGAGKSTLIDEMVRRFLDAFTNRRLAILANDPTTSTSEGIPTAQLADRVRMNNIYNQRVFMRSLATGSPHAPLSPLLPGLIGLLQVAGFDLIMVETPGTGQTGLSLKGLKADLVLYLKTREYGSVLQLEKDQMLREADLIVLNKLDQEGAEAAFEELGEVLAKLDAKGALFGATTKTPRDPGLDRLFEALTARLGMRTSEKRSEIDIFAAAKATAIVPHSRRTYLARVVEAVRAYDTWSTKQLVVLKQAPDNLDRLDPVAHQILETWPQRWRELSDEAAREMRTNTETLTLNGLRLPKVALPDPEDRAESLRFLLEEGLPGTFPFVTGIYPLRRASASETTRQFAGLRGPEETNARLHYLAQGVARPRLSIAFDTITLYGDDSDDDPASIGKIGEGGVAVDTWEDMKLILKGFSLPDISTSMTINGPAAAILAMYFAAAQDLEREREEAARGRPLSAAEKARLDAATLRLLRGTVQADILKEVQAQNESIFQPDFAVKLIGDVQEFFIEKDIRRFYSLSVSGYHIGEAGAAPAQELAYTLANGFTYVEYFLSRGMAVDAFVPNLSFFFRVSHEAEWLAYGAVARKIWAVALRDLYGGSEAAQRFKFHTQTSGRALQAEEWDTLNPPRQTYHALMGLLANTNSLHVDSADEPMTTPGAKYVRQATMIPNYLREEAEAFVIQNLLSGSYAFRTLFFQVQEQVLTELERLDQLGGVIPATEQGYIRRRIAESSSRYERQRRHVSKGETPPVRRIIGYNSYELPTDHPDRYPAVPEISRPDKFVWQRQLERLAEFRRRHSEEAPEYLGRLKKVALSGGNVFAELQETVRHATLGQITRTLAEVGGRYRKIM